MLVANVEDGGGATTVEFPQPSTRLPEFALNSGLQSRSASINCTFSRYGDQGVRGRARPQGRRRIPGAAEDQA